MGGSRPSAPAPPPPAPPPPEPEPASEAVRRRRIQEDRADESSTVGEGPGASKKLLGQ